MAGRFRSVKYFLVVKVPYYLRVKLVLSIVLEIFSAEVRSLIFLGFGNGRKDVMEARA